MSEKLIEVIKNTCTKVMNVSRDYDSLIQAVGGASIILIGEASHGTHEFYHHRVEITKRLILEKGFQAVAVEADWPDAYRVNRYVQGLHATGDGNIDKNATEALGDFIRFPTWMWRNTVVRDFVEWLRQHNDGLNDQNKKVGWYGLDLYSLFSSISRVIEYLSRVDPAAAQRAIERYSCFEDFGEDSPAYGYAASFGTSKACRDEVISQLTDMLKNSHKYVHDHGMLAQEEFFYAMQNAEVVKGAESYYRKMFKSRTESWNVRDEFMTNTTASLAKFMSEQGKTPKIVVWAHNSHLGDARATERTESNKLNVGQLVRERFGIENTFNIGFTTYIGTVIAANEWGRRGEIKKVIPGMAHSYEKLFHEVGIPQFMLLFRSNKQSDDKKDSSTITIHPRLPRMLQRAIGVIYRPQTERLSHYLHATISQQFDTVIHVDTSTALAPLESGPVAGAGAM